MTIVLVFVGVALLAAGAEAMVRGATDLAAAAGISPLVAGLTIVGLTTSAPEIAVTLISCSRGQADLALGNIVGSNIFNVLVVLGVCAVIAPVAVHRNVLRIDVPVMVAASLLLMVMAGDHAVGRGDGAWLVAAFAAYLALAVRVGRAQGAHDGEPAPRRPSAATPRVPRNLLLMGVGLVALVVGSRALIAGAIVTATTLGLSELVIGLTVVAAGTSLPEVATSVVAALRGQPDIAIGNVVGSSISNILGVLGLAAVVAPGGVPVAPPALHFDLPVMVAVAVVCLPIAFTGSRIVRWEGALLLAYYGVYTAFLILNAGHHAALPAFSSVTLAFVLPLSALALGVSVVRQLRASRAVK